MCGGHSWWLGTIKHGAGAKTEGKETPKWVQARLASRACLVSLGMPLMVLSVSFWSVR